MCACMARAMKTAGKWRTLYGTTAEIKKNPAGFFLFQENCYWNSAANRSQKVSFSSSVSCGSGSPGFSIPPHCSKNCTNSRIRILSRREGNRIKIRRHILLLHLIDLLLDHAGHTRDFAAHGTGAIVQFPTPSFNSPTPLLKVESPHGRNCSPRKARSPHPDT